MEVNEAHSEGGLVQCRKHVGEVAVDSCANRFHDNGSDLTWDAISAIGGTVGPMVASTIFWSLLTKFGLLPFLKLSQRSTMHRMTAVRRSCGRVSQFC